MEVSASKVKKKMNRDDSQKKSEENFSKIFGNNQSLGICFYHCTIFPFIDDYESLF